MKIRSWLVTLFIGLLLIAAGAVGFSCAYEFLFDPERIGEEKTPLSPRVETEEEAYRREIFYPFFGELEETALSADEQRQAFLDLYHIDPTVYEAVLELASLTWEDVKAAGIARYEYRGGTVSAESYYLREMFLLTWEPGSGKEDVLLLIDENRMPVYLVWGNEVCGRAKDFLGTSAKAEDGDGIRKESGFLEGISSELFFYLARLDGALDSMASYHSLLREGASAFSGEEGEMGPGSLEEYGRLGEWECYGMPGREAASGLTACVFLIADRNLVLYYDRGNSRFCGYNLALNSD